MECKSKRQSGHTACAGIRDVYISDREFVSKGKGIGIAVIAIELHYKYKVYTKMKGTVN